LFGWYVRLLTSFSAGSLESGVQGRPEGARARAWAGGTGDLVGLRTVRGRPWHGQTDRWPENAGLPREPDPSV